MHHEHLTRRPVIALSRLGKTLVNAASVWTLFATFLSGCASFGESPDISLEEKLARVGLERISEEAARIPPTARGHYVACQVLDGGSYPKPLPPHPAGYLLVGVTDSSDETASATLEALTAWSPGEFLTLRVRRNPYHPEAVGSEWWEKNVTMVLPEQ